MFSSERTAAASLALAIPVLVSMLVVVLSLGGMAAVDAMMTDTEGTGQIAVMGAIAVSLLLLPVSAVGGGLGWASRTRTLGRIGLWLNTATLLTGITVSSALGASLLWSAAVLMEGRPHG